MQSVVKYPKVRISRNTWNPATEEVIVTRTAKKRVRSYAIIGEEATVIEAKAVDSAMWVSRTLLVLKINPQEIHPVAMVPLALFLPEVGATSPTTRRAGTKMSSPGRVTPGDPTLPDRLDKEGTSMTAGPSAGIKVTVIGSPIAPISTISRIFPNTISPKGFKEPTEGETTEINKDIQHSK